MFSFVYQYSPYEIGNVVISRGKSAIKALQ